MDEDGEYAVSTYIDRFGSWNQALRKNGFDIVEEHSHKTEDMVNALRELGDKIGRRPTYQDVNEHTNMSATTFYTHFDSFDEALEEAGFVPSRKTVYCDYCSEELSRKRYDILNNEHHFCGRPCLSQWLSENKSGEDSWNWKGGGPWDYGPNWEEQRQKVLERDGYKCRACGKEEQEHWRSLAVHHIKRIQWFKQNYDEPEWYEKGNAIHNLVTYCDGCHSHWEGVPIAPQSKV